MVRNDRISVIPRPAAIVLLCAVLLLIDGCNGGGSNFTFAPKTLYNDAVVGDLNGDGKPDIAASAVLLTSSSISGFLGIYLQDPNRLGTFLPPTKYSVSDQPIFLSIADLNGDGKPDLLVRRSTLSCLGIVQCSSPNTVISVFLQDPAEPGQFLPPVDYSAGEASNTVAIGDLDGDGKPDLVVTTTGGLSVYFQNSNVPGAFLPPVSIALSSTPTWVAIADLNGDQKPDLAVTTAANVLVLLQSPTVPGTFSSPVSYAAGSTPTVVASADLNDDGLADLAVTNFGDGSVSVFLQDPAAPGTFLPAKSYPTGPSSNFVTIADLNGDGKPDLVVVNPAVDSATLSVLLQDPSAPGQFKAATNYPCPEPTSSVAVADMNGDGKPDLVITESDVVVLRLQDPTIPGSFLAQTVIAN